MYKNGTKFRNFITETNRVITLRTCPEDHKEFPWTCFPNKNGVATRLLNIPFGAQAGAVLILNFEQESDPYHVTRFRLTGSNIRRKQACPALPSGDEK